MQQILELSQVLKLISLSMFYYLSVIEMKMGLSRSRYRILVTGAGGPAGINVIKQLKRKGHYVVSTDINPYSEGFVLSDKYYLIPPADERERFIEELERVIERESIDLVIPTVDEEIAVLANNEIKYRKKIILHPKETVDVCLNKLRTYEYFSNKIPELIPEYSDDPKDLKSEIIVKKPIRGRGSRGILIGNKSEFRKEEGYFFVEYLPGREWTVDAVTDKNGKLFIAIPRVRLKARSGVSVIGEVKMDRKVIVYVEKITEFLKFTGGFNVQFREDSNGEIKLQEINLRFSGGLDITEAAGVNLPHILVSIWMGKKMRSKVSIREGIYVKIHRVYRWK